jgi:hypothetical protein
VFVEDVPAALKQAQAVGTPDLPGFRAAAVLHDPAGPPFGIFTPKR